MHCVLHVKQIDLQRKFEIQQYVEYYEPYQSLLENSINLQNVKHPENVIVRRYLLIPTLPTQISIVISRKRDIGDVIAP